MTGQRPNSDPAEPAAESRRLALNGGTVMVRSTSKTVVSIVDDLFSSLIVGTAEATNDENAETTVSVLENQTHGSQYRIVVDDGEWTATHVELPAKLEYAVLRALLDGSRGCLHLHAAGAVGQTGAVLALGPSDAGKSTMALTWSVRGAPLLGDDIVFLDPDARVRPFQRHLKGTTDRGRALGLDLESTPYWQAHAGEFWFDPSAVPGAGWGNPSEVSVIALLNRRSHDGLAADHLVVTAVPPARIAQELVGQVLASGDPVAKHIETVFALAEQARGLELEYAETAVAAEHLLTLVEKDGT